MTTEKANPAEMLIAFLEWRGIEAPCSKCGGAGSRAYGSTAAWRGGIGGQAMTCAVCDHCWGSGDEFRHWTDLRKLEASKDSSVRSAAEAFLTDRLGARFYPNSAFEAVQLWLLQFGRKRTAKQDARDVAVHLASAIEGMGKK